MKGLPIFNKSPKDPSFQVQSSEETTRSSFLDHLRRILCGPPKVAAPPVYKDEKKYIHQPTHSGSSFIKTTTTAAMMDAQIQQADAITLAGDATGAVDATSQTGPQKGLI